jgi:hypothetical protein
LRSICWPKLLACEPGNRSSRTGNETRTMGWMTQFVLGCAVIAEMVAGIKQRFASIALRNRFW